MAFVDEMVSFSAAATRDVTSIKGDSTRQNDATSQDDFLGERYYVTFALCRRKYGCLSVVRNVVAPYQKG